MSSRIGLTLERLTLDDLLFLESELERRKEKYRRQHVVMAVQTEQRIMTTLNRERLQVIAKEMRRYVNECAVAGNGVVLAYAPDVSLVLFRDAKGASLTATRLLTGLADLNGKIGAGDNPLSLKLGLASGTDVLAAGSMRSLRQSALVKRAGQCAWKSPSGSLLMDEQCAQGWEPRGDAMRLPLEIDGLSVYRATPSVDASATPVADEDRLIEFLNSVAAKNISTLKYFVIREEGEAEAGSTWSKPVARAVITLEGFDPTQMRNMSFTTRCAIFDYANKVDRIRRIVSDRGLGLVKHDDSMPILLA